MTDLLVVWQQFLCSLASEVFLSKSFVSMGLLHMSVTKAAWIDTLLETQSWDSFCMHPEFTIY